MSPAMIEVHLQAQILIRQPINTQQISLNFTMLTAGRIAPVITGHLKLKPWSQHKSKAVEEKQMELL